MGRDKARSLMAAVGWRDDPPGAAHHEAATGTQDLPIFAGGPGGNPPWGGDLRRHHLHSGAGRILLLGGGHGLGQPLRAVVGVGQHDGGGVLRERGRGGVAPVRRAADLEHGPGQPPTACGRTFTSDAYTRPLLGAGVRIGMDGKGRWMDNRFIERLWRSMKYEAVYLEELCGGHHARRVVGAWLDHYNHRRPHLTFAGKTPAEVYCAGRAAELPLAVR